MTELFHSSIFHCVENSKGYQYIFDGVLVVDQGKIVQIGEYQSLKNQFGADTKITQFKDSLIIPGFIDTHLHYPQYKIIGSFGADLLDWLNKYTFVEEQKFSDISYAKKITKLFLDETIKNGTTTAMTFCTTHKQSVEIFFEEAKNRNLRMVAGKVMMDRNGPAKLCDTPETSYLDTKNLIKSWHNNARLHYAITPRFAPTSSLNQLKQAALLLNEYGGKDGVLLQTHLNENQDEIAWVKKLFPESKNYFDVYQSLGIASSNCVFAHGIYNTEAELNQIAATGSKVALCPNSNLFLGSGLFDLNKLQEYKISVALASDIGGGDSFSMFAVMNNAYKICKLSKFNLSPVQAFYLTTLAAAKVLNLDHYLGNFLPKKEADFVVLDLNATQLISERLKNVTDISEILFCLMMLGDDRLIKKVYILGDLVHQKTGVNNG